MQQFDQFVWIVHHVAPLSDAQRDEIKSPPPGGRARITFEESEARARELYPQGRTRTMLIDQFSGEALGVKEPQVGTAGDVFMQWRWTRIVRLTGLVCPLMFVTGVIRWLQKRRARASHDRRAG